MSVNKKTLLVLAAGQGSRYGGNKQTEWFGPHHEMIMDYSIYDAIRAGFNKVVFVIRRDFYETFKITVENRWKDKIELHYVFQDKECFCKTLTAYKNRVKPWGTGHAILCSRETIKEPFLMINADDFYGRESFLVASKFLGEECFEKQYGLISYLLNQTVSLYGTVSRGICETDEKGFLIDIKEHKNIVVKQNHIFSILPDKTEKELDKNSKVSMNFFCFHPSIFNYLENGFTEFLQKEAPHSLTVEYLIPTIVSQCIRTQGVTVLTKDTKEKWFGVTYKEDAKIVVAEIKKLIQQKIYPEKL